MWSALINGTLGLGLSLGIGITFFGVSAGDLLAAVLVSNLSGVFSLFVTLRAEKVMWGQKKLLDRSFKTWTFIITLYVSLLLLFIPPLRSLGCFFALFLPLLLSTGFGILAFGPLQDYCVRKDQRKALELQSS